jgi:hypothetical protein
MNPAVFPPIPSSFSLFLFSSSVRISGKNENISLTRDQIKEFSGSHFSHNFLKKGQIFSAFPLKNMNSNQNSNSKRGFKEKWLSLPASDGLKWMKYDKEKDAVCLTCIRENCKWPEWKPKFR